MFAAGKTAAVSGGAPDDKFNYVTMLLHGDGTNGAQNNTFVDSSSNNFSITRNGNATQGSFSPYGSNWSNYFNGDPTRLSLGTATALGTGNVTVEFWFNTPDTSATYYALYDGRSAANTNSGLGIFQYGQTIEIYGNGLKVSSASSAFTANTWTHFAVVRTSGTCQIYINGVASGSSASYSDDFTSTTRSIGRNSTAGNFYTGYISNLREVTSALYSGTFTPSTTALTAVSGTTLLTCQSNRFVDNSTNAYAITATGTPSVQRFNPFGTSTAYSTSVIGGSGYFDGSGDYLNVGNPSVNSQLALGSNDFTIQAWVYPRGTGIYTILGSLNNSNGNGSYWLMVNGTFSGGGTIQFGYNYVSGGSGGNDALFGTGTLPVNAWSFVAVTRSGSNLRGYVNGVQVGTTNTSIGSRTIYPTNQALYVGRNVDSDAYAMNGYLSDVQLVNGTALYTGTTMTVPTAPASAITNTALLCNMTNGAIYDNAMMNDLETVGNAQISTSVVKYGTGSLAFDGTGDYLTVPISPNMSLGTGDFTIECWVRFVANPVGNGQGVCQLTNGYLNSTIRGPAYGVESSSGEWTIYYGTTYTQSGVVPTTGVWYHTAYVRSSGTTKLYVNGTSVISVADTTNYTDQYFTIGGWYSTAFLLNGYIDDFRITKGYARYTTTFTPPTAAFSNTGPI